MLDDTVVVEKQISRKVVCWDESSLYIDCTKAKTLWRFIIYLCKGLRKINVVYPEDNFVLTGVRIIIIIWPLYQHGYIFHAFYRVCILCIHIIHTNYWILNVDKQMHESSW